MSLMDIFQARNPWWRDPERRIARGFPVRRACFEQVLAQLLRLDRRAQILLGPRQVGKTVLLRQIADELLDRGIPPRNLLYFDLSDDRLPEAVSLREVVEAGRSVADPGAPSVFLIDEIQAATPGWDRFLKSAIDDAAQPGAPGFERFVAAGSAASSISAAGRESGLGRWDEIRIEGLSFSETFHFQGEKPPEHLRDMSGLAFDDYLERGGFPAYLREPSIWQARERMKEDIVGKAILKDLLRTHVNVDHVRRLFVSLIQGSGEEVNPRSVGDDLGDHRAIANYLELLLDTRLVAALPQHLISDGTSRPKQRARLQIRRKLYAADHGLISAFSRIPDPAGDPHVRGQIFEAVVFRHLRDLCVGHQAHLSYVHLPKVGSTPEGEVDFFLEGPSASALVEVTSSQEASGTRLANLRRAGERLGTSRLWLVNDSFAEDRRGDVGVLPVPAFLLEPGRVLEAP